MMTDHAELARLAEVAGGAKWKLGGSGFVVTDELGADIKPVADFLANPEPDVWVSGPTLSEAMARAQFSAAANPARVLALLAEIAALRASVVKSNDGFEEYERKFYLEQDRATQAERQRDEALEALGNVQFVRKDNPGASESYLLEETTRIARTFLASMEPKT